MRAPTLAGPPREVADVIGAYPAVARRQLLALRRLILETADATLGVGPLTETLRWREPAYLTQASGSGSMIRLGWTPKLPDRCALLFHCRTTLVETFRRLFSPELEFVGNRAIVLRLADPLPRDVLRQCISMALTYNLKRP